jgi:3-oxoacyl-[acyl-carrier-protein] synthase III
VRELTAAQAIDLGDVDLLVATASVPGFADSLARRLGVSAERVAAPSNGVAGAHTAAPALALESVRLDAARTTLFVCAGAGITVAAAIYRA